MEVAGGVREVEVEVEGERGDWAAGQKQSVHVHLQVYRGAIVYKGQVKIAKRTARILEYYWLLDKPGTPATM
jgi:hypothetical protein